MSRRVDRAFFMGTSHRVKLQESQDVSTPLLFDEAALPIRDDWVRAIHDGQHKHTGARLLDDERKVLRLVELLMSGWSIKRIATEMQVSRHTVRAAREALVARGEVAHYKERVVRKMEEIIEVGLTQYAQALEDGKVPPAQIPVGVGIISDKRALAMGEPTTISAGMTVQVKPEDLTVERINSWWESLAKAQTVDVQSTGNTATAEENHGK
nr:helix-turn-helix domain-containing protein [uncultured Rhodopila sp.]